MTPKIPPRTITEQTDSLSVNRQPVIPQQQAQNNRDIKIDFSKRGLVAKKDCFDGLMEIKVPPQKPNPKAPVKFTPRVQNDCM